MAATNEDFPLIPVRMLNEFVYCPRLGYQMWVQGEFAPSADTVDGSIKHRRVDRKGGQSLPVAPDKEEPIHARSVSLSSMQLGITAKIDLVEGQGCAVRPIDYKRGKRPHVARGAYDPERVQLCAQGLLLREHGYACQEGDLYFVASKERVPVVFDEELTALTRDAIQRFREVARQGTIPAPLEDSPKCPRCSLVGICLPEEIRFLGQAGEPPRPIFAANEKGLPLYVQSPRAYVRKNGERLIIEVEKEKVATVAYGDTSQVVLFGNASLTTPALHECLVREIPVTWLSYGGWFMGRSALAIAMWRRALLNTARASIRRCAFAWRGAWSPAKSLTAAHCSNATGKGRRGRSDRRLRRCVAAWERLCAPMRSIPCWASKGRRRAVILRSSPGCSVPRAMAPWDSIWRGAIAALPAIPLMPCCRLPMPCSPANGRSPWRRWA